MTAPSVTATPPSDPILYDRRNAVALITINRPTTLNALDMATLATLDEAVARAAADPDVRVLVFTGAGERAFVAGGDIADLDSRQGLPHYLELGERLHSVFRRIETLDKPTIAAVNGWALGGGTELLLCIDIRIAAQSARFGLPEINLGLFPGAGGSQRLIRQIPLCRAKELMFTGSRIDAEEAQRLGLINRVVPDAEVLNAGAGAGRYDRDEIPAGAQAAQAHAERRRRHAAAGVAAPRAGDDWPRARHQGRP